MCFFMVISICWLCAQSLENNAKLRIKEDYYQDSLEHVLETQRQKALDYHRRGEIQKALRLYEALLKQFPEDSLLHLYYKQAKNAVHFSDGGFERYIITPLPAPINSPYPDYAAVWDSFHQCVYFTSRRPRRTYSDSTAIADENIYKAYKEGGHWQVEPVSLWNSPHHDAIIGLTPKGDFLIYRSDFNGGDIFIAQRKPDGSLQRLKTFSYRINSPYVENSAFITADGKELYFVSNRPGGFGRRDIYVCYKDAKGRWGPPKNLGPKINTPWDEDAPYVSPDGKRLYFASNGPHSMGGFDIFVSYRLPDGTWSEPQNLGAPLNSPSHDIYLYFYDENRAYLSSDRGHYGAMDLYEVYFKPPEVTPVAYVLPYYKTTLPSLPRFSLQLPQPYVFELPTDFKAQRAYLIPLQQLWDKSQWIEIPVEEDENNLFALIPDKNTYLIWIEDAQGRGICSKVEQTRQQLSIAAVYP